MMGVANQQLSLHKPLRRSRSIGFKIEDRSKIPVITLDWDKAAQWSQMLIGKADALVPGYLLPPELEIEEDINSSFLAKEDRNVSDLDAAEIVKRFRMTTSPLGRELAGLLAASPVINLPVVRLIQESLLPKSNQVQVAEVFLGGLLRPQSVSLEKLQNQESESKTILSPDSVEYEFIQPEIRDIFLDDAPISDSIDVVNAVSRYVAEQLGVSLTEFMAVLKAPQQAQEDQREDIIKPFAKITARVLRKLGGQYVQFAEELEQVRNNQNSYDSPSQSFNSDVSSTSVRYQVGGALPPDVSSYVTRDSDHQLLEALKAGEFCYVLNSRQMGKTSLIVRTLAQLQESGWKGIILDLSARNTQSDQPSPWYNGIINELNNHFKLLDRGDFRVWLKERDFISPVERLDEFIETVLLPGIIEPIVIFVDEIDSTLGLPFTDDFFALIRACYERRAVKSDYKRLTFALLGVAAPSDLMKNKSATPFNIGTPIDLNPFPTDLENGESFKTMEPLLAGGIEDKKILQEILDWTGGQPFLTQQLCELVVTEHQHDPLATVAEVVNLKIINNWQNQDNPTHLKTIEDRLSQNEPLTFRLLDLYKKILQSENQSLKADNSQEQHRLKLSGLVLQEKGFLKPYNRIYTEIFNESWVETEKAKLRIYNEEFENWRKADPREKESYLLYGAKGEQVQQWRENFRGELYETEARFLDRSQEFWKKIKGFFPDLLGNEGMIESIIQSANDLTGGFDQFNKIIFDIAKTNNVVDLQQDEVQGWLENLVLLNSSSLGLFEQYEPFRKDRDQFLNQDDNFELISIFERIAQKELIPFDNNNPQHRKLKDMCFIIIDKEHNLQILNKIYEKLLNQDWIKGVKEQLRPYTKAFQKWEEAEEEQKASFLLRGQALKEAATWAEGKWLSDEEHQFLDASVAIKVKQEQNFESSRNSNSIRKILFLSANLKGTNPLRLGEEVREIDEGLRRSKYRDLVQIHSVEAVRVVDIRRAMLDYEPNIVHFSGHGVGQEGLVFEDEIGQAMLVSAEALTGLFSLFADRLDCVLLNACYSEVQAQAISQQINYVIGTSQAIGDRAAIAFAVGFYDALGADRGVDFAYKFACNSIQMEGIPEHLTPKLLTKVSEFSPLPTITTNHYVERPPIEQNCYQNILKPGILIRIKAPEKMGKSSLLNQILAYAKKQNYQTICLDFQLLEDEVIKDSSQFLRWLCEKVSKQLQLADQVDDYSQGITPNMFCTNYFGEYLLPNLDSPLVLALDNVDRFFEEKYQVVAADFFGMLRSWWENAQQTTDSDWQKLRLIVVYSTKDLPKLNIYQSPVNVGEEVKLPDFNRSQVQVFAQQYGLNLLSSQVEKLTELLGGHPYLLKVAFEHLKTAHQVSLDDLLVKAVTNEGIYHNHLQEYLLNLENDPELAAIFKEVVISDNPIRITNSKQLYKLESMGLIAIDNNRIKPRYPLYRLYFREQLR
jgi:hypothetical protein